MTPIVIDIYAIPAEKIKLIGTVSTPNIFISGSKKFDPNGLFSETIFGPYGDPIRKKQFGQINLYVDILHPEAYTLLCGLNNIYEDILSGSRYARFDRSISDFVIADEDTGRTGYSFFMEYIEKISFKETESRKRKNDIAFVKKAIRAENRINRFLVLPAGLRDYTEDASGVPSEDEINSVYRVMLTSTALLANTKIDKDSMSALDPIIYKLQKTAVTIHDHFFDLVYGGKNKFMQNKFTKRAIAFGTRNVISPSIIKIKDLRNKELQITPNHTVMGVYQYAAAISPAIKYKLRTMFISGIMSEHSSDCKLVDTKTLKTVLVPIPVAKKNEWLTVEGLDNIINKLSYEDIRLSPVKVDKYYLMLVYDDGHNITVISDTEEITKDMDIKYIRPITYLELFYIALYNYKSKYPIVNTRYPATNQGSIYPSYVYLKSTITGRTVHLTIPGRDEKIVHEYPILTEDVVTSASPHPTHIGRLDADFDGDKMSFTALLTEDSIEEISKVLNSPEYYLMGDGTLTFPLGTTTLNQVMASLTKREPV